MYAVYPSVSDPRHAGDPHPTLSSHSFIFINFSVKNLPNNKFAHPHPRGVRAPL